MIWHHPTLNRRSDLPPSRVSHELSDNAKGRLAAVTWRTVSDETQIKHDAVDKYEIEFGEKPGEMDRIIIEDEYKSFIKNSGTQNILSYIEVLLNFIFEYSAATQQERFEMVSIIERILIEDGVLWKLNPQLDEMYRMSETTNSSRSLPAYIPSQYEPFEFQKISSEAVEDADQRVQALAQTERWSGPLKPYNDAWDSFQSDEISSALLANLYNSLEKVLEKICVELEEWNTQTDTVSDYLDSLNENGLMDPDPSMYGEWTNIVKGLRIGVQKSGRNRTSHETIDRDYALLLLHQTGAFINFTIQRYEGILPDS